MENDDTSDARFHRRFIAGLATFLVLSALGFIFAVVFLPIPQANIRFADTTLGFILGTVLATPIGFYFGASKVQSPGPVSQIEGKKDDEVPKQISD